MIINEFMKKKVEYEVKTGIKPTRVYLGTETAHELYHYFRDHLHVCRIANERMEISGLKVYIVDDYSHCEVG